MTKVTKSLSTRSDNGWSQVLLRISNGRGHTIRVKSGIFVPVNRWKDGIDTSKAKLAEKPELGRIRQQLSRVESIAYHIYNVCDIRDIDKELIEKTISFYKNNKVLVDSISCDDIMKCQDPEPTERKSIYDYADLYLEKKAFADGLKRGLRVFFRYIARYEMYRQKTEKDSFVFDIDRVTRDDIEAFFEYIKAEPDLYEENPKLFADILRAYPPSMNAKHKVRIQHKGNNTMVRLRKWMRQFWNWLLEEGATENNPLERFKVGSLTDKTPSVLNYEQLKLITEFDFGGNKHLETQRDIFVFHCWVGCRISDLYAIRPECIKNGILTYIPIKTKGNGIEAKVALSSIAMRLIKKYEGVDRKGRLFPYISEQKYRDAIREILTECEIDNLVMAHERGTGNTIQAPINEVASSGLARRTFSMNGSKYASNKDVVEFMLGHRPKNSKVEYSYKFIDDDQFIRTISEMESAYNGESLLIRKLQGITSLEQLQDLIKSLQEANNTNN